MDSSNEIIDCDGEKQRIPMYRGVRRRSWGRWVSEIREPGKKKRIWLGSYATPQMAARAYDVAAVSLKGKSALPNFPHLINSLPRPASLHPRDIQMAAAEAAFSFARSSNSTTSLENVGHSVNSATHSALANVIDVSDENSKESHDVSSSDMDEVEKQTSCTKDDENGEVGTSLKRIRTELKYSDEELHQFDSPNLLINMAEALLLTPPRLDEVSGYGNSYVDADYDTEVEGLEFLWSGF
ncbi:hypothetical protein SUGI_0906640 [Cryptomeria japonica]|uniref:ethylene-responsive transcription factor ERF024-like n=1 Tax=Cryptomeria japonica TaxID=3369 RepID=UPI0024148006|nr:ethylene-responsive transcription factor ERF024-like [Cryptomeria japonica]GLJ43567.1 hypothetical protein SUGI_0906640 [Cryptomeria japonica]